MSPQPARRRRRILIGVGIAVLLIAAAGTVFALTRPGDVSNPDVEFRDEPTETPVPDTPGKGKDRARDFLWAHYGYSKDRRKYLPVSSALRPPYRQVWSWNGNALLEFSPVMADGKLFIIKNNGAVYALDKRTGKPRWQRKIGTLAAASPAYG